VEDLTLAAVIATALFFDFTNGFHDTANAIATSVSTRALTPRTAVILAAILNFAGAFASFAVATSGLPSAFRSRIATDWGPGPVLNSRFARKRPLPLLMSTETV